MLPEDLKAQMFEAIGEIVMALVDGLKSYFPAIWEAAKGVLGELWEIISENVGNVVDCLGELWETVSEKVKGFFEGLGEWLYDAREKFRAWLGEVIGNVVEWGVDMYNKSRETAENFLNNIIEFIKQLPQKCGIISEKRLKRSLNFLWNFEKKEKKPPKSLLPKLLTQ